METLFTDKLLRCADCLGEFIFTAGEQLFFHDKQFKNDPKRCKPCKSRRSGPPVAKGVGPAAAGLSRTETRTTCSECGVDTTVPFKPTQGRPVLCRMCFQGKNRVALPQLMDVPRLPVHAPAESPAMTMVVASLPTEVTISALTLISTNESGAMMSASAMLVAASSMASASAESSVASAADLASISGMAERRKLEADLVPTEMLAAANLANAPAELASAMVDAPEA